MSAQQSRARSSRGGSGILRPNSARAGFGGIGGGTGLVALAQAIGPKTVAGAVILYLSPAISLLVGAVLYYFEVQASRYLERRLINNVKKTLQGQLNDPLLSDALKNDIRKKLEELELLIAKVQLEEAKVFLAPR